MVKISKYDDMIDSRDLLERMGEITCDCDTVKYPELLEEFAKLKAFRDELADVSGEDLIHGACAIRDSYFEDYAQELADDIGALPAGNAWPAYCIDWARAARELQHDYSLAEFDGVDYWVRS